MMKATTRDVRKFIVKRPIISLLLVLLQLWFAVIIFAILDAEGKR